MAEARRELGRLAELLFTFVLIVLAVQSGSRYYFAGNPRQNILL
jgi:hypothetical protein